MASVPYVLYNSLVKEEDAVWRYAELTSNYLMSAAWDLTSTRLLYRKPDIPMRLKSQ